VSLNKLRISELKGAI